MNFSLAAEEVVDLKSPKLCPYYLVDYCPYGLFVNTKRNLGTCKREHSKKAKEMWDTLTLEEQYEYGYIQDFKRFISRAVYDMDRRIRRTEQRAEVNPQQHGDSVASEAIRQQTQVIDRKIEGIMDQMDELEVVCDVDGLEQSLALLDKTRKEKEDIIRAHQHSQGLGSSGKEMRVCSICGALLVAGDAEKRIQAHLEGKQHVGFYTLRESLKKIEKMESELGVHENEPAPRERGRSEWDRDRDRDRGRSKYDRRDNRRGSRRDRPRGRGRDRRRSDYRGDARRNDRRYSDRGSRRDSRRDRPRKSPSPTQRKKSKTRDTEASPKKRNQPQTQEESPLPKKQKSQKDEVEEGEIPE